MAQPSGSCDNYLEKTLYSVQVRLESVCASRSQVHCAQLTEQERRSGLGRKMRQVCYFAIPILVFLPLVKTSGEFYKYYFFHLTVYFSKAPQWCNFFLVYVAIRQTCKHFLAN